MNSKLSNVTKNNNIKQIYNYFNTNYNNLKNKLILDIKAAQALVPAAVPVPVPVPAAVPVPAVVPVPAQVIQVKKNALLIGCNYIGTQYQLSGCINDVENIQNTLKTQYGFNNILIMSDNTSKKPTISTNHRQILDFITNLLSKNERSD